MKRFGAIMSIEYQNIDRSLQGFYLKVVILFIWQKNGLIFVFVGEEKLEIKETFPKYDQFKIIFLWRLHHYTEAKESSVNISSTVFLERFIILVHPYTEVGSQSPSSIVYRGYKLESRDFEKEYRSRSDQILFHLYRQRKSLICTPDVNISRFLEVTI